METIRYIEAFGGIGAFTQAINNLNIPNELIDYIEHDVFCVRSFNAINNTQFPVQDVTEWTKNLECDLLMGGPPCQDISLAGKQKGAKKGSGTRSSLLFEMSRMASLIKPKYIVVENVRNLVSDKHRKEFDEYLEELRLLGYESCWSIINSKDQEMPQNRERVFIVSIHGSNRFSFPNPKELKIWLKDLLESEVDEKYYLSESTIKKFSDMTNRNGYIRGERFNPIDLENQKYAYCIDTREGQRPEDNFLLEKIGGVAIPEATVKGYAIAKHGDGVYINRPHQKRGCVQKGMIQTLTTSCKDIGVVVIDGSRYRIRRLTPLECWRLMGFKDECFYKAKEVNSKTQLYKQAGNSIVVNVLEAILKKLFLKEELEGQISIFDLMGD